MTEENTLVAEPTQVIPADLGSLPAKYQYALQCDNAEERCCLLKEAAETGCIPAMCDDGLMCQDGSEEERWLREAGLEGHQLAVGACAVLNAALCERRASRQENGHIIDEWWYELTSAEGQ